MQIYDTSNLSSKLKLVASGEHTPLMPGNLTAWETHVTLKSHLHGFCSGGQISLRFELLRPQASALPDDRHCQLHHHFYHTWQ